MPGIGYTARQFMATSSSVTAKRGFLGLLALVVAISYVTAFHNFWQPQAFYWDENYYVTDAQREMNGIFYLQIHPPLGKMLIALGERVLQLNPRNDQFIGTEHASDFPSSDFSITGYRLVPALLGWWCIPVFFLILFLLTGKKYLSFFGTFPLMFDNAILVHHRGAMLDGPLLFFFLLSFLLMLLAIRAKDHPWKGYLFAVLLGVSIALTFLVKYQGLIAILLVAPLLWKIGWKWKKLLSASLLAAAGFLATFVAVWHVHFSSLHTINTALRSQGTYDISQQYRNILERGTQGSLRNFPVMIRDTLAYVPEYNKGIPQLNLCKPDENGSPWFFWPLGIKSISYRWNTPDGENFQYLYLQANPVAWGIGLLGLILSVAYFAGIALFGVKKSRHHFSLVTIFLIYAAFMLAISSMDRVLFLYTYFIPLVLSFLLFTLTFDSLTNLGARAFSPRLKLAALTVIGTGVVLSFLFFSPFTYYKHLTNEQFERRDIFALWQLKCANCEPKRTLCFPVR